MTTEMEVKAGEAAAGSVWNKNSWHWEEKDYNKVAQQKLREVLEGIALTSRSGEAIRFYDVEPNGFASISVRKGKKVVVFEYNVSMNFRTSSTTGTIKIPEFSNDELTPTLRVDSSDEAIKDYLRKEGAGEVKTALAKFLQFVNSAETGDSLIEADKKRREEEIARAKQAEVETGTEKQRIAEQVKAKEQQAVSTRTFVEASVWNPNSYHWETRKLDKWASEWIRSRLDQSPAFTDIVVSGEAENSIRKGKKISIFNLKIEGKYNGEPFSVPSFSNEEGDDEIPRVTATTSDLRKEISTELTSSVFKHFLMEMKDQ